MVAAILLAATVPGPHGNVYLDGEPIEIALPPSKSEWTLVDYDGHAVMSHIAASGTVALGVLPTGFYRLIRATGDWVSLAVLAKGSGSAPRSSPISIDVAASWFYPSERIPAVARLCRLAGVSWVRDRLTWSDVEPERDRFAASTRYDLAADAQSAAGLQILQVNHSTPPWAGSEPGRFPSDLRDIYGFYREAARRWAGKVGAFEPWNEADIPMFGGHTGAEMASLQKAAYWGLKAGNPSVTVCQNVWASHPEAQQQDFAENEAWPYFDTYNLHHYESLAGYPKLYADHRAVSGGRPMWVSECAIPVNYAATSPSHEISDPDLREQAERLPKVFASALTNGASRVFYFMLPHYPEGPNQFGILREDLTPRPAYSALAAVGRLLADAKPIGQVSGPGMMLAFRAVPGGVRRTVLVAWSDVELTTRLPARPLSAFDVIGRPVEPRTDITLTHAPVFYVFPAGVQFPVTPPPSPAPILKGKPCAIVMQAAAPRAKTLLALSAYLIPSDRPSFLDVALYNFSGQETTGTLKVVAPTGWEVDQPTPVRLAPMERKPIQISVNPHGHVSATWTDRVRVDGDFGPAGTPVLSVRLMPDPQFLAADSGSPVPGASDPAKWESFASSPEPMRVSAVGKAVEFEATQLKGDAWVFPKVRIGSVPPGALGIAAEITRLEGDADFRTIFAQKNGSCYVADFAPRPERAKPTRSVALFLGSIHGDGWSKDDAKHHVSPEEIETLAIGCNTKSSHVRFRVSNLRWITQ